jgi:hypothetical protein
MPPPTMKNAGLFYFVPMELFGLPWSQARTEFIKGGGDPNAEELRQWREAKCRQLANGSDWCWIAWAVPATDGQIAGYALFVFPSYGDPDDRPILKGIFDTLDDAQALLRAEGALAENNSRAKSRCIS